jgi:hypothetical protein
LMMRYPLAIHIGGVIMDLDLAIKLCRNTRRDVRRLLAALERKELYDVGHEVGQSAVSGLAFKDMPKELTWLEQLITVENYPAIYAHEWSIFDLVNYYDRVIDLIRSKDIDPQKLPPIVDSLYRWRDNAGKLAQIVCQIEDEENP